MLIWPIDPIPDFLSDHTLTGEQSSVERLREVVSRWVQWVENLWGCRGRAAFALRFFARDGEIQVFFLAEPYGHVDAAALAGEVGVLLRSHRLGSGNPLNSSDCRQEIRQAFAIPDALVEVRQYVTNALWQAPKNLLSNERFKQELPWVSPEELERPRVVYPWWAPGGPFLVMMESLISQPTPASLTIYLEPTALEPHEWKWLASMAREAQSHSEQHVHALGTGAAMRKIDPAANLAGRLYIANLRRLSATPFLVAVHCGAPKGRKDVARSLAGSFQSLVQEQPFDRPQQDDARLPSAAEVYQLGENSDSPEREAAVRRQYQCLRFQATESKDPLWRIPYLADARGATLGFRLPVSVRGGVPGLAVRQSPPDFHPGRRVQSVPKDHLLIGDYEVGGMATFPLRDLTRHALVTGLTGSGKSVTALQILHQLWADFAIPFLVLESAKQEYRGMFGVPPFQDDLRVYTVGNELCVPFRFNPFELLPGVRVESHIGKLQTCIEGAIPPLGPSSSVIAEALVVVYEDAGWTLNDVAPTSGHVSKLFPTLSDFINAVERVIAERGYEGEVRANVQAALLGRLRPLLIGGKGCVFNTQRSFPDPNDLFSRPTVIELNDLNLDDKALVVMFLLTMLREYREQNRATSDGPTHVTLVEEAHNVLENVASRGTADGAAADTRFKVVEAFCHLLAEVRSFGEGIIIVDQSPEKLARDALRNTNLQIAHQLRDGHDREAMANAMIMEQEQRDFLGKLVPGQAALFHTGLEKATFVRVPRYYPVADVEPDAPSAGPRGVGFRDDLSDTELSTRMQRLQPEIGQLRAGPLPFEGCTFCKKQCQFRDEVFPTVKTNETQLRVEQWIEEHFQDASPDADTFWRSLADICTDSLHTAGVSQTPDSAWCWLVQSWHRYGPQGLPRDQFFHDRFTRQFSANQPRSIKVHS
ncbi:MAG: ATP-binding protein [Planctomycetes bacterium]|nr:ATP-binding protein [Planctomycetota bacterium]